MSSNDPSQAYARIHAKAWQDEGYRQRLLDDPAAVLREEGLHVPEGKTVRVVENTPDVAHFVLPAKPASPLREEDLTGRTATANILICFPP